jgi:hypothetical protein
MASIRYVADVGRDILVDSAGIAQLYVLTAGRLGYVVFAPQDQHHWALTLWYDSRWRFLERWGV